MTVTAARWTVEEYHRLIETGVLADKRVELINGEIVEMPPEGPLHSDSSTELRDWLTARLQGRASIREGHPITLAISEPEPDIAVVRPGRYRGKHPGPMGIFLLIEIAESSLSKDLNEKAAAYAQAGIADYWVISLKNQEAVVFRTPRFTGYQQQHTAKEGTVQPLAFLDLKLPISLLVG